MGEARRVVLDTNVLLDLWVFADPRVEWLARALEDGRLRPLRSARTDRELAALLVRPPFGLAPAARDERLAHWQQQAEMVVEPLPRAPLFCRDPDDQPFLDLAFAGHAVALLTHDRDLLKLAGRARRRGVRIASPRSGDLGGELEQQAA